MWQVFRTARCGFGLRCRQPVEKGTFLVEYTGGRPAVPPWRRCNQAVAAGCAAAMSAGGLERAPVAEQLQLLAAELQRYWQQHGPAV